MDQKDYPFKKGLFPKVAQTRKQAITKEDIQRLKSLELNDGSLMEVARDIFLLEYDLAGIDYVDLIQLPVNIIKKTSFAFYVKSYQEEGLRWKCRLSIRQEAFFRSLLQSQTSSCCSLGTINRPTINYTPLNAIESKRRWLFFFLELK